MTSCALNVTLLFLFFYTAVKDWLPSTYYDCKPCREIEQQSPLVIDNSSKEVIRYFKKMPLEWLLARLKNQQPVENGYTQYDLALAILTEFHYFDIKRAFSGLPQPEQKRTIIYGKYRDGSPAELTVYPGLSQKHYEAIIAFVQTERWPLTSKGLFMNLRKGNQDPSLADAFLLTPEFLAVELLFGRGIVSINKKELLSLVLQADWTILSTFANQQKASQDLSASQRHRFLIDYMEKKSKTAAHLLLKSDGPAAALKLDDAHLLLLLELLDEKSPETEKFALDVLTSPRSDAVRKMAAARLAVPIAQKIERMYLVQEGDSLWKISRRFNINLDALKSYNKLNSDILKPGMSLKIP